jgi:hypothetical protein
MDSYVHEVTVRTTGLPDVTVSTLRRGDGEHSVMVSTPGVEGSAHISIDTDGRLWVHGPGPYGVVEFVWPEPD